MKNILIDNNVLNRTYLIEKRGRLLAILKVLFFNEMYSYLFLSTFISIYIYIYTFRPFI